MFLLITLRHSIYFVSSLRVHLRSHFKIMNIKETRGGHNQIYPFSEINIGSDRLFTKALDSIRSAASNYARRHNMKFVCRTERDDKNKKVGVRIYRIK